ncbi:MAG: hypothetical protein R3B90_08490 [Planctomycetaceae bacterium]
MSRLTVIMAIVVSLAVWLPAQDGARTERETPRKDAPARLTPARPQPRQPERATAPDAAEAEAEHAHSSRPSDAHDHSPEGAYTSPGITPFSGDVLGITLKSDPSFSIYLKQVTIRQLGQGTFLVGVGADSGAGDWTIERRTWVAVDDIAEIVEFKNEAELKELLDDADAAEYPEA